VELAAAASRAVDDGLFVMSATLIAAPPDNPPRSSTQRNYLIAQSLQGKRRLRFLLQCLNL